MNENTKSNFTKRDLILLTIWCLFSALVMVISLIYDNSVISVLVAALMIVVVVLLLSIRRMISNSRCRDLPAAINAVNASVENCISQVDALFNVFQIIPKQCILPASRGWAASPDFLRLVANMILINKPSSVLELGSGLSTLIVARCLQIIGAGKLLSLDHESNYANNTRAMIEGHKLSDWVDVCHAPLTGHIIEKRKRIWYDLSSVIEKDRSFDMVIVDGPPGDAETMPRYPAIPLLAPCLQEGAILVLDDGGRRDVRCCIAAWREKYNILSEEYIVLEKGAYVLRFGGTVCSSHRFSEKRSYKTITCCFSPTKCV